MYVFPLVNSPSGSLEQQEKEVLIYFVDNPVPRDGIDYDELKRVDEFKKKYTGLYSSYDKYKVIDHLHKKVIDYKRNNLESAFPQRESTKKKIEKVNLKNLIHSGSLTVMNFCCSVTYWRQGIALLELGGWRMIRRT